MKVAFRSLLVAMLVTLVAAAGCSDGPEPDGPRPFLAEDVCGPRPDREEQGEDWSKETWNATITAIGPFALDLPVPISTGGTNAEAWAANVSHPPQWSVAMQATERGPALRLQGSGSGTVLSCSIRGQSDRGNGCCAEQFLAKKWSTTTERAAEEVPVRLVTGEVALELHYSALSNWCGSDATFAGSLTQPGWADVRGTDMTFCE